VAGELAFPSDGVAEGLPPSAVKRRRWSMVKEWVERIELLRKRREKDKEGASLTFLLLLARWLYEFKYLLRLRNVFGEEYAMPSLHEWREILVGLFDAMGLEMNSETETIVQYLEKRFQQEKCPCS